MPADHRRNAWVRSRKTAPPKPLMPPTQALVPMLRYLAASPQGGKAGLPGPAKAKKSEEDLDPNLQHIRDVQRRQAQAAKIVEVEEDFLDENDYEMAAPQRPAPRYRNATHQQPSRAPIRRNVEQAPYERRQALPAAARRRPNGGAPALRQAAIQPSWRQSDHSSASSGRSAESNVGGFGSSARRSAVMRSACTPLAM